MNKKSVSISPEIAQRIREAEEARARQIAEIEAEHARVIQELEEAEQRRVAQIEADYKDKGRTYVEFIEELCELFNIPRPGLVEQRNKKTGEIVRTRGGKVRMIDPDLNGEQRVAKLRQAIQEAMSEPASKEEAQAEEQVPAPTLEASLTSSTPPVQPRTEGMSDYTREASTAPYSS